MRTFAVDYETYYRKKDCSVTLNGPVAYALETDAYLVAIAGDDGTLIVEHPSKVDWDAFTDATWLSHNRTFDYCIHQANGFPNPTEWHCTADLMAYLHLPRNLAQATQVCLGRKMSKTVRDAMNGKTITDLDDKDREDLITYAAIDAVNCLELWQKYKDRWPLDERRLSWLTTLMCIHGVGMDLDALQPQLDAVNEAQFACRHRIPWSNGTRPKGKSKTKVEPIPLGSKIAFEKACIDAGVPVPDSTAKTCQAYQHWLEKYVDKVPFARALADHRSVTRTKAILDKLPNYVVQDRLRYGMKYCGAFTGRWSGDSGLNMHNWSRSPDWLSEEDGAKITNKAEIKSLNKSFDGEALDEDELVPSACRIYLRELIVAPPKRALVVADWSAIEARMLLWMAGDERQLSLLRDNPEMDLYEVHARATMGYRKAEPLKDTDPNLRQLCKVRVLGCLEKDTPVLTKLGDTIRYVRLDEVTTSHMVWDGQAWVHHEGVIFQGWRETIPLRNERFTSDHEIYTGASRSVPAESVDVRSARAYRLRHRASGDSLWKLARFYFARALQQWRRSLRGMLVRTSPMRNREQSKTPSVHPVQLMQRIDARGSVERVDSSSG